MAHNNNVGSISATNTPISIKGNGGEVDVTTDTGSIIGLRYIKDDELGTGSPTTTLANIDSVSLKNWFSQYVSTLGKFTKEANDNKNIKFSDYKGATILGFKIEAKNETSSRYKSNDNASLQITPLNGSLGSYTVTVGSTQQTANAGGSVEFTGFDGSNGGSKNVYITDDTTGVTISVIWYPAYENGSPFITCQSGVSLLGKRFNFTWDPSDDTNRSGTYSKPLFLFLGEESTRAYGESYGA